MSGPNFTAGVRPRAQVIQLPTVPPPYSATRSWWLLLRAPVVVLLSILLGVLIGAACFGGGR